MYTWEKCLDWCQIRDDWDDYLEKLLVGWSSCRMASRVFVWSGKLIGCQAKVLTVTVAGQLPGRSVIEPKLEWMAPGCLLQ